MRVLLHYKNKDFSLAHPLIWNAQALIQDLNLEKLFNSMGGGDELVEKVSRTAVLTSLENDKATILYRQDILKDCLQQPALVSELYEIASAAIAARKEHWYFLSSHYASSVLSSAAGMLGMFADFLEHLRLFAEKNKHSFNSEGFQRLLNSFETDLSASYLAEVEEVLDNLKFEQGILVTARLSHGNRGADYALRRLDVKKPGWWRRLFPRKPEGVYEFSIHPRDEGGVRALGELKDTGMTPSALIMAGAADHVLGFFQQLQLELAFYLGCMHLADALSKTDMPVCFPAIDGVGYKAKELYDVCMALTLNRTIVSNDLDDQARGLVIITGANQGGKSTFLRSVGLAHLLAQAGIFVGARNFSADICHCLFTHFKREEDTGMKSGKFDEEMSRVDEIAEHLTSDAVGLFNESFAATNEREGSEIARQIVTALWEKGARIFFVTHQYAFAHGMYQTVPDKAIFLRAERRSDAQRTYKVTPGEPLPTSFALDVYKRLFPKS